MARRFAPDGTPRDNEFQVNQVTTMNQAAPSVAADSGGDFVITWQSYPEDGSYSGIYARRYGASGTALGNEFQVNTYTTNYQAYPRIPLDAKGRFMVAWQSYSQDGDGWGTFAQRFDSAGNKDGTEFQVNVATTSNQDAPAVAMTANGHFAIAWASPDLATVSDVVASVGWPL